MGWLSWLNETNEFPDFVYLQVCRFRPVASCQWPKCSMPKRANRGRRSSNNISFSKGVSKKRPLFASSMKELPCYVKRRRWSTLKHLSPVRWWRSRRPPRNSLIPSVIHFAQNGTIRVGGCRPILEDCRSVTFGMKFEWPRPGKDVRAHLPINGYEFDSLTRSCKGHAIVVFIYAFTPWEYVCTLMKRGKNAKVGAPPAPIIKGDTEVWLNAAG